MMSIFLSENIDASCTGTTTTWTGTNQTWLTASNWDTNDIPDTATEDVVTSGTSDLRAETLTVGCVTVASGRLRSKSGGYTLSIAGYQFSAPNTDTFLSTNSHNLTINMVGTSDQVIDVVDNFDRLIISNNNTVTIQKPVRVMEAFTLAGTTTTLRINGQGEFRTDQAVTIPSGVTVEVNEGATWYIRNNLTVDGVLKINAGATLRIRSGRRLIINSGGVLQLNGASGNSATIKSQGAGNYVYLDMSGTMSASYFVMNGLRNNGLNCTGGTISSMDNGEFRFGRTSTDYITLNSTCSIPATMNNIGFFDDGGFGNLNNIDAASYSGASTTLNDWSGEVGGDSFEIDGNNLINWGAEDGTKITLSNLTRSNEPGGSTSPGEGYLTYASLKLALSAPDTLTNITDITVSMSGTAIASDVEAVRLYRDTNDNCLYDDGVDTQIGGDQTLSGTPGSTTFSGISAGVLTTSSSTDEACFFIRSKISNSANDEKTLALGVQSSSDITNDQGYIFSTTSSPPVYGNTTTISNGATSYWDGSNSNVYTTNGNWLGDAPTLANGRHCSIGAGSNFQPQVSSDPVYCLNATLASSGSLDWNNTTNEFNIQGSLTVESGFTFSNVTSGPGAIRMNGSSNTAIGIAEAFPGHFYIQNTGSAGSNNVTLSSDSTLNGDLTIVDGVLSIQSGRTLYVNGNIVVQSGGELNIGAGGMLVMGNGTSITINTGGTLRLVGTLASNATISASGSNSWTATINGNLYARYYTVRNTNDTGFVIGSGATIDATENLQDGSFLDPQGSNPKMLVLNAEIPGDQINNMVFDDSTGSGFTGSAVNIDTSGIGSSSDTLQIPVFSGNLSGSTYDDDPNYLINWQNETTTIKVTAEATAPATMDAGSRYVISSFGFEQGEAGVFADTDITSLTLTLYGSGSAADISAVRTFLDSDCDETGGTLLGTGTFSGSPAKVTFTYNPGAVTVVSDPTTPPKICIYTEVDIAGGAVGAHTVGIQLASETDVVNDQSYDIDASTPTPISTGTGSIIASTSTIWTGGTSTDWTLSANWTGGVPDQNKDCEIGLVTNNPVISSGVASCRSINITNGSLTISSGAILDIYQNFTNTGTLSGTGDVRLEDDGVTGAHSISSTATIHKLVFDMTASGSPNTVEILGSSLDITTLEIPSGQNMTFTIGNGNTLNLANDLTINSGTVTIEGGGKLTFNNGNTLTVAGGTLTTNGNADLDTSDPNNITQNTPKGTIEVSGAGTWGFLATSGTVNLKGFLFDELDANGMRINGSTSLLQLNGGQFTSLSTSYASMNAIQINTTGAVTANAYKIGFQWDSVPANTESYTLVNTTGNGCSNGTLTFTDFFGNWYEDTATFDVETKNTDNNCTVTFGDSATAVSISSLTAAGYNGAIDIQWETGFESNHLGFNIYRSSGEQGSLVQVNTSLLLNLNDSGSHRGKYRFIDKTVTNGETYYYYVEDVAFNLTDREFHGPVWATADASAGNPPSVGADVNSGESDATSGVTTDPGTIKNPTFRDLGDGVVILSQTSTNLRLKINPAAPTFSASAWNGSYEDVAVKSYSSTLVSGAPQLLEREILIEVYSFAEGISLLNQTMTESSTSTHVISPAPSWSTNGSGNLVASYSEDSTHYSNNSFSPADYFNLSSNLVTIGRRKFIKLLVSPVKYNPVTDDLKYLTELVLDISINGNSWDQNVPDVSYKVLPEIIANNLKIHYTKSGLYELAYDDLEDSSVDFPFAGESINNLRLYIGDKEIPLEISDSDGTFNSGDTLKFFLEHTYSKSDALNVAILTTEDFSSGASPLRISTLDGNPNNGWLADEELYRREVTAEENLTFVTSETVGDSEEHFFWKLLSQQASFNELDFTMELPGLSTTTDELVEVELTLKGRTGVIASQEVTHHVALFVNDMTEPAEEVIFTSTKRETHKLNIDADLFINGTNNIRIKVLGSFLPSGEYDLVYVDKMKVRYSSAKTAIGDQLVLDTPDQDFVYTVNSFTNTAINVYDISDPYDVRKLSNTYQSTGTGEQISFLANSDNTENLGTRYAVNTNSSFIKPAYLSLTSGFEGPLHDSARQADLIVIGHASLLRAAEDLIAERESQGLVVAAVEPEQIFAEFSKGVRNIEAFNDFINYTITSWGSPAPRYLLILGDSTFDSLDHNIGSAASGARSAEYAATLPISLGVGEFFDFSSDADLAAGGNFLPQMAVGRIPTNSPSALSAYVEKVLNYESGTMAPADPKTAVFVQDVDYNIPDRFKERGNRLASLGSFSGAKMSVSAYHRDDFASAGAFETQLTETFNNSPLWLNLWGHGAFDVWGDDYFFDNTYAKALTNTKLPIVISLSCENAYFYEDTVSEVSLGEDLLLNKSGGAIIFIGSTAQTRPESQERFIHSFASVVSDVASKSDTSIRLGDVFYRSQQSLGSHQSYKDIIRSMHILGDPTLKLPEKLFEPPPPIIAGEESPGVVPESGGGCSLFASPGHGPGPLAGFLEYLFMTMCVLLPARWGRKK